MSTYPTAEYSALLMAQQTLEPAFRSTIQTACWRAKRTTLHTTDIASIITSFVEAHSQTNQSANATTIFEAIVATNIGSYETAYCTPLFKALPRTV